MLVRMYPDVIDLKPAAVVFLAGSNDIARNTEPTTLAQIEETFQAMVEIAHAHGIKVILCSVTPISDYARTPQTTQRPPADILKLNACSKITPLGRMPCTRIITRPSWTKRDAEERVLHGRSASECGKLQTAGAGSRGGN
jgi:hypothetical protein